MVADANGWVYTADNTIEKYDTQGRLISITYLGGVGAVSPDNPASRTVNLAYDFENKLISVTDDIGSSLTFTYGILDLLVSVTHNGTRTWEYGHDVITGNLVSVLNPDGTSRIYHYEDFPDNINALTGITDERGIRYATWEYDLDGKAISSYHANNVNRVDVNYVDETTRIVTNSRGGISSYTVTNQNQSALITNIDGPGCSTCAESDSSYLFDGQNNTADKTVKGVRTRYSGYSDTKYPREITVAVGTGEETRTTVFYDPRFNGFETEVYGESVYPAGSSVP